MFDDVIAEIENAVDMPYPERTHFLREVEADLWAHYDALIELGLEKDAARAEVLRHMELSGGVRDALTAVHAPIARRLLLHLPKPVRDPLECVVAALPLIALAAFTIKEVPMFDFFLQGGWAMWLVVFIGGAGLFLQSRCALSWFVLRDHTPRALARFSLTPLYLAAATMALGLMATGVNAYTVLFRWANGNIPAELVPIGMGESLTTLIMGGLLAACVILFQAFLHASRRNLGTGQTPAMS